MTWTQLITDTATRAGCTEAQARAVLEAFVQLSADALEAGRNVPLRGLGTLSSVWRAPRTLRSVANARRLMLDGRFVPVFKPSSRLRERMASRTPQRWKDTRHQEAWRLAEALVGDLGLYHGGQAPTRLSAEELDAEVHAACAESFGPLWSHVVETYEAAVPSEVRAELDHLAHAARRRWAKR